MLLGPPSFDYMAATTLHGFREVLGQDRVTDYPTNSLYYEVQADASSMYSVLNATYVHGLGYTWGHRLENSTTFRNSLNRGEIRRGIVEKRWDLVIYPHIHRGMPYWDLVRKHYSKESIVLIDAEDWASSQYSLVEYLHSIGEGGRPLQWPPLHEDWRSLFHQGIFFKRETDFCPEDMRVPNADKGLHPGRYYPKFTEEKKYVI